MIRKRVATLALALLATCAALAAGAPLAAAEGEGPTWKLEQPPPPPPEPGVESSSTVPIGLGKIGDIEFFEPNRGALITAGVQKTIPPGVWAYNGRAWTELSNKCGGTDGRIAWAGPDEFWTISDGRPGQALGEGGQQPPLEDDTLCHFAASGGKLRIVASYATLAFKADSYQAMHSAACFSPSDCWFAGDPLPSVLPPGAFQLHWNGSSLTELPYPEEGHAVEDMKASEGRLYESVRLTPSDRGSSSEPPPVHILNPEGIEPLFEPVSEIPLYGAGEFPTALDFLRLSPSEGGLWGAAGPQSTPAKSLPGQVTVVRDASGTWMPVIGPSTHPSGQELFPSDVVNAMAAEPGTNEAWLATETEGEASEKKSTAKATVSHITAEAHLGGPKLTTETLPTAEEEVHNPGGKGAADKITCPAPQDCWMATTGGWLFHLAFEGERQLRENGDPAFATLITERPLDAATPQLQPDAQPPEEQRPEPPPSTASLLELVGEKEVKVTLPLLTGMHSRLVHGTTLELRFHLAVKARIRLLAKRRRQVVASTPTRTFAAGSRRLTLRLDRHRWPTKLDLQTHALAPLPTGTTQGASNATTVGTSLVVLPRTRSFAGSEPLG